MAEAVIVLKNIYYRNKAIFLLIIKILISAGILTLILYQINLIEIFKMVKNSNKLFILSAFILGIANVYLQFLKWELVCNIILEEFDKKKILISLLYGFSAGSFTPARIGEFMGRAFFFTDRPLLQTTAATIVDKLCTMLVVTSIGIILFLFYLLPVAGYCGIAILAGLLIYFTIHNNESIIKNLIEKCLLKFRKLSKLYSQLSFNWNSGLKLMLVSILFYACFILQFALLISAFTNHFTFFNYLWAGGLVMFIKTIIPISTFGDFGIREGASIYFIKHFGEPAAAGFNASIVLFIINVLFPALIGLIFIVKKKC